MFFPVFEFKIYVILIRFIQLIFTVFIVRIKKLTILIDRTVTILDTPLYILVNPSKFIETQKHLVIDRVLLTFFHHDAV